MKKMPLSLVELQIILGKTILSVIDENQSEEERATTMATASCVYAGARNLIHNASTIMRAKELIAEGKVKDVEAIKNVLGE